MMTTRRDILALIAAGVALPKQVRAGASTVEGTVAEAMDYLKRFFDPAEDKMALTSALEPTADEIAMVYQEPLAGVLVEGYGGMFQEIREDNEPIQPPDDAAEVLAWGARLSDLHARAPVVQDHFPGGYEKVVPYLQEPTPDFDPVVVRWKFVAPGETTGRSFDGLWKLGDRWALMFKPWIGVRRLS